jgi:predicted nucleic acid-binding protein
LILYLDASALVKAYIRETGSGEVQGLLRSIAVAGTSPISKVEMAAAIARAWRVKSISQDDSKLAWQKFQSEWPSLYKIAFSETTVDKAASLAWEYSLRGYDAVHLAAASIWQEALGEQVTLVTFDQQLWRAGEKAGLLLWPGEPEGRSFAR